MKITALLSALNSALAEPFALAWSQDSPRFLLVFTVVYAVAVIVAVTDQKNTRPGAEHGSAAWGDVFRLNKSYMDKRGPNLLLTQHFRIGIDGYKHKHNTNILIVGGSGAGKTRTYGVPNVLECACSMVITDPKAEILRKTGNLLKEKGYEVIVFDLINPAASFCYNPFVYVHDDREVLTLIENLIQNTTPSHSKSNDPFWEKSETALLQALMLYLLHEAPPEEQNFSMVMEMIAAAEVHEDDDTYQSPLDILFERLEMREPDSIACKQYRIFKQAAGKTAKSILVSVGVRLSRANQTIKSSIVSSLNLIIALYTPLATIVLQLASLVWVAWYVPILIAVFNVPYIFILVKSNHRRYELERKITKEKRVEKYFVELLSDRYAAKDIRTYDFLAEMDLNGISIFNVGSNTVTLASGWDLMAFIRQMISPENGGDAQ